MKLTISNIAWQEGEDEAVYTVLRQCGITALEIAPTRFWQKPAAVSDEVIIQKREQLLGQGFGVVAAQALVYGKPELKIFGADEERADFLAYLEKIIHLCGLLGAQVLVFGSPKNRLRGSMPLTQANGIAIEFFRELGKIAELEHTCLCIEPNPAQYQCDFIQTSAEALHLVQQVNHPGFGLHLDASAMILNGEDPEEVIHHCAAWIKHFHISAPYLAPLGEALHGVHQQALRALNNINYPHWVSIEMRSGEAGTNAEAVRRTLAGLQAFR